MPLDIEPELVGLGGARHDRLHLLFRQAKSKVYARPADSSIFPTSRQSNCTCPALHMLKETAHERLDLPHSLTLVPAPRVTFQFDLEMSPILLIRALDAVWPSLEYFAKLCI